MLVPKRNTLLALNKRHCSFRLDMHDDKKKIRQGGDMVEDALLTEAFTEGGSLRRSGYEKALTGGEVLSTPSKNRSAETFRLLVPLVWICSVGIGRSRYATLKDRRGSVRDVNGHVRPRLFARHLPPLEDVRDKVAVACHATGDGSLQL